MRYLPTVSTEKEYAAIRPRSFAILAVSLLALTGASLPAKGPMPVARPSADGETRTEKHGPPAPTAAERKDAPASKDTEDTREDARTKEKDGDGKAPEAGKPEATKKPPPPLVREDDATLAACIGALKAGGAIVEEIPAIGPENGCGIARPIVLKRLSGDIGITPEATLRCETALQLQRWTSGALIPAITAGMPDKKLTGLEQASGYVCRNRNGAANGKVSEHAYGNAVDIAAFIFSDGSRMDIAPREKDSTIEGALQRAAVATACLYFTTVLDPGSDAAHETHLHLDVIKRKGGYRYCW